MMENYQLRVVIEKAELEIKINNLRQFLISLEDGYEHEILSDQLLVMEQYRDILKNRIRDF